MLDIFHKWYRRYLFEEESVLLLVLLTIGVVLLMSIGDILAPVLAALVLAFLMEGVADQLERRTKLPRALATILVFLAITLLILFAAVWTGLFLSRRFTEPLLAVSDATRRFAGGDGGRRSWESCAGFRTGSEGCGKKWKLVARKEKRRPYVSLFATK